MFSPISFTARNNTSDTNKTKPSPFGQVYTDYEKEAPLLVEKKDLAIHYLKRQ